MEGLARRARMAIARDLDLATSVSRLGERMRQEQVASAGDSSRLLRELSRHPSLFRVVDPWRGPWRAVPSRQGATRPGNAPWPGDGGLGWETADSVSGGPSRGMPFTDAQMVVPVDVEWADGDAGLSRRLRESLYRIGRSVDEHSAVSIARWARLVRGAAATQRRLRHARAPEEGQPTRDVR